jgi:hypothetical protein
MTTRQLQMHTRITDEPARMTDNIRRVVLILLDCDPKAHLYRTKKYLRIAAY